jgi:hypothetical protein
VALSSTISTRTSRGRTAFRLHPPGLFAQTRGEPELRAFALFADYTGLTAHQLSQLLRGGQPQAGAAVLSRGRGVHLAELVEEQAELGCRNADARVAHREAEQHVVLNLSRRLRVSWFHLFHQRDADRNLASRCELDGIARQVDENLAQAARVAAQQHGNGGICGVEKLHPLLVGTHGQRGGEVVKQARQIEVQRLQVEFIRLDLGNVENIVDQDEQRFATGAHDVGVAPLFIVQFRIQQQPGHADNPVHGGPDFVAHVSQKLALGNIGHFRLGGHAVGPRGGLFKTQIGIEQFILRLLSHREVMKNT